MFFFFTFESFDYLIDFPVHLPSVSPQDVFSFLQERPVLKNQTAQTLSHILVDPKIFDPDDPQGRCMVLFLFPLDGIKVKTSFSWEFLLCSPYL